MSSETLLNGAEEGAAVAATLPVVNISVEDRIANTDVGAVANQANATTAIIGISGSGKTCLADTASEYAFETFGKITLGYIADLGGFGNKRLTLIRRGIMRVYDPRNHVNPFETMELISLGAFPETLDDPERGFAAPDVRLVLPRRIVFGIYCPQDHLAGKFDTQAAMQAAAGAGTIVCPSCGIKTDLTNCARTGQTIVRHRMFRDVGCRIYDSFTALNDWGLADLQEQSARGTLPTTGGGGRLLGAADALISGSVRFGSSSEGQYGFMQNRTYGWLANIKKIPDQIVPAIATFHIELSKESPRGGGDLQYGPKIAGQARTSAVPGWVGNCLHASKEPYSVNDPTLVHRLWLTTHIDPRDPAKIPYAAKHRGTPLDMPNYLEDAPGAEPWSGFSLAVFFRLLDAQLAKLEAQAKEKYPNAPGIWRGEVGGDADEVIGTVMPTGGSRGGNPAVVAGVSSSPTIGGGRTLRRAGGGAAPAGVTAVAAPAPVTVPPAPQVEAAVVGTPAPAVVPAVVTSEKAPPSSSSTAPAIAPSAPTPPSVPASPVGSNVRRLRTGSSPGLTHTNTQPSQSITQGHRQLMSTSAPDINSTTARPDPGGEWYPEGDLPEQGFGSRNTLMPAQYAFVLPANLTQLWHEIEIKDPRPFLPNGQVNPTRDQLVKRWQLKLDRNAPLVVQGGPFDGEPMTATFTTNPRPRGGKKDDPKTAWISDVTYLLDTALQGNMAPGNRVRPKDAAGVIAEINKYAGKVVRIETGLTAQCRPDRERYIRVTVEEGGVPQTTDMKDPAGIKGCGKRFYTRDFKNPDAGVVDAATGKAVPAYDTEIACDCGANPAPAQVEAGAQPGQVVVLRGFEQVERFMPPLGAPGK